uniref:Uncharacterized protein n=1 Tax=Mycena chlorophos TaxID=658473 RepID=A0ABQ0LM78_MYCCL|nr:predicted protein [Mycena chlorophos]
MHREADNQTRAFVGENHIACESINILDNIVPRDKTRLFMHAGEAGAVEGSVLTPDGEITKKLVEEIKTERSLGHTHTASLAHLSSALLRNCLVENVHGLVVEYAYPTGTSTSRTSRRRPQPDNDSKSFQVVAGDIDHQNQHIVQSWAQMVATGLDFSVCSSHAYAVMAMRDRNHPNRMCISPALPSFNTPDLKDKAARVVEMLERAKKDLHRSKTASADASNEAVDGSHVTAAADSSFDDDMSGGVDVIEDCMLAVPSSEEVAAALAFLDVKPTDSDYDAVYEALTLGPLIGVYVMTCLFYVVSKSERTERWWSFYRECEVETPKLYVRDWEAAKRANFERPGSESYRQRPDGAASVGVVYYEKARRAHERNTKDVNYKEASHSRDGEDSGNF